MAKEDKFETPKRGVDGPEHPQSWNKGGIYLDNDGKLVVSNEGRQN